MDAVLFSTTIGFYRNARQKKLRLLREANMNYTSTNPGISVEQTARILFNRSKSRQILLPNKRMSPTPTGLSCRDILHSARHRPHTVPQQNVVFTFTEIL